MKSLNDLLLLEVAPDGLEATLLPLRPHPRRKTRPRHLARFLHERGIVNGCSEQRLRGFIEAWKSWTVESPWWVARGTAATPPTSAELLRVHPPARSGNDSVELLPLYVKKGDLLFTLVLGRKGVEGCNVLGEPVPFAEDEEIPPVQPGPGVVVEGQTWRAGRTGFLVEEGRTISISKSLLHYHDLPTGVYRWPSSARIEGSISAGTVIDVAGHLTVKGEIGGGVKILAGGNLMVEGSIHGEGTTSLEAEGDVYVDTVDRCTLHSGRDLHVRRACIDCNCRGRGYLIAGAPGCKVVGGRIEAVKGATLFDVGSTDRQRTLISVGASEWVDHDLKGLEGEIRRWTSYHARLYHQYQQRFGSSRSLPVGPREDLATEEERLVKEQQRVDEQISRLKTRQSQLHKVRERDDRAVIRIIGQALPGCRFVIRGKGYSPGRTGLSGVTLSVFQESGRVHGVPTALFESSEMA
ncbi:MAG: FapA family protein [Planctomycetota bacterium]